MRPNRICHITTAHSRFDIRIFLKELVSLSMHYECHLIVGDGRGNEKVNNISIWDVGRPSGRLKRALTTTKKAYNKAVELDCDLYHFHDPEFVYTALRLKRKGKKVVYDIHEDVPRDILSKDYLKGFKKPVSILFERLENFCAKRFTYLITATPHIGNRFKRINPNTVDINNYPLLKDFEPPLNNDFRSRKSIVYIGAISRIRGIKELVQALSLVSTPLELAGNFESADFEKEVKALDSWKNVRYYGLVDRRKVKQLLETSVAGIVTFYPEPNHVNAQPNKIFEYMSAGLPVICSDFPAWREIIEKNNCGILVNPLDPASISTGIKTLLANVDLAVQMGNNGVAAVHKKYNWEAEQSKLLRIYQTILN